MIEESFTLSDLANPLSLVDLTRTTDVNGRIFTESFDRASLTRTNVTPEGRTSTTVFDANGRVVQTQLPGRLPTDMSYEANGRLIEVTQGPRSWSYAYDARSELDSVTNPLSVRDDRVRPRPRRSRHPRRDRVGECHDVRLR